MTFRPLPPLAFLRECFSYNPKTGKFRWKHRPERHFDSPDIAKSWNAKWANTAAFTSVEKHGGYMKSEVVYEGSRYRLRASRVAYKLITDEEHPLIDHENRKTADNRFENLRPTTNSLNMGNTIGKPRKVLPKGVFFEGRKFVASIHNEGSRKRLGSFSTPAEAHAAYCAAAKAKYSEFFNPGPSRPSIFD